MLGALFLAIRLWAWGEKVILSNISVLTDLGGLDPGEAVCGGWRCLVGTGFCWLHRALQENTFLLKCFSVFLSLIFLLMVVTGILAFIFKD